jgi:hypothetical protein
MTVVQIKDTFMFLRHVINDCFHFEQQHNSLSWRHSGSGGNLSASYWFSTDCPSSTSVTLLLGNNYHLLRESNKAEFLAKINRQDTNFSMKRK